MIVLSTQFDGNGSAGGWAGWGVFAHQSLKIDSYIEHDFANLNRKFEIIFWARFDENGSAGLAI